MTLDTIAAELRFAGIEEYSYEAMLIVSHVTGKPRSVILAERSDTIDVRYEDGISEILRRRTAREPLQYIIGEWDFMGFTYSVSPVCLIPRSDTELLCKTAVSNLPQNGRMLDLCCGSGCIGISAAALRSDAHVTLLELYHETADIARQNAKRILGKDDAVRFVEADATSQSDACANFHEERFDVIVSNPPYITADEMKDLEPELSFEPRHALTDEGDGMSIIRAILRIYVEYLAPNGYMAIEHGASQGEQVEAIIREMGFESECLRDLSGHRRVTAFRRNA